MTSQPEPLSRWPGSAGSDQGPAGPGAEFPAARVPGGEPGQAGGRGRSVGGRGRRVVFGLLLALALGGLATAAVGIAHQLLPRHFTPAQQRQITGWEMERRWLVLPAGKIFPAAVPYTVSWPSRDEPASLKLQAQRLAISPPESCGAAVSAAAARVLDHRGCSTALRATYVDSSGSMVATIVVAVLPASAPSRSVAADLKSMAEGGGAPVQAFAVAGTPAAGFGASERQIFDVSAAGPYVILSTAGFTATRRENVTADDYVHEEMQSLADGLVGSAEKVLGTPPRPPVCPGAPGC